MRPKRFTVSVSQLHIEPPKHVAFFGLALHPRKRHSILFVLACCLRLLHILMRVAFSCLNNYTRQFATSVDRTRQRKVEAHGQLLRKIVRRKKLTQEQAADLLGFSRAKLNRLFKQERIDEVTLEEIEKIFQVPPSYFPTMPLAAPKTPSAPPGDISCWQQLAEARQEIINLQRQIIAMSTPNINAPVRTKGQPA